MLFTNLETPSQKPSFGSSLSLDTGWSKGDEIKHAISLACFSNNPEAHLGHSSSPLAHDCYPKK
ncbi:MAG: hypothetical protein Ct9H90mP4_08150 [Gammaproteobacteria bacterium]|nr:MAG: hypothetical protein Ct9H90mP4_08150 [Gammaproteobacteria bacterium]